MGQVPAPLAPSYRNEILRSLPPEEMARLRPHLTRVRFVNGQVLHEAGERMEHAYFIEQGFVSMVAIVGSESQPEQGVEVALIGRESMVGLALLLGGEARSYNQGMIQLPGTGYRLPAAILVECLSRSPFLYARLQQGFEYLIAQVSQTAGCNGRHILHERLARWLLMAHDRIDGDELALTQEFLSIMLAVRRSGVTTAIQDLEGKGLVRHSRGRILIADRPGLESAACSCYGRVRRFEAGNAPSRPIG